MASGAGKREPKARDILTCEDIGSGLKYQPIPVNGNLTFEDTVSEESKEVVARGWGPFLVCVKVDPPPVCLLLITERILHG